jgi:hypothetical protein
MTFSQTENKGVTSSPDQRTESLEWPGPGDSGEAVGRYRGLRRVAQVAKGEGAEAKLLSW